MNAHQRRKVRRKLLAFMNRLPDMTDDAKEAEKLAQDYSEKLGLGRPRLDFSRDFPE